MCLWSQDSGCECSLDELESMDAWTKTLVAIKVLTAFKKRRKKKMEKMEQEKIRKERRKTLWKRLGFKLRVFNIFANKISSDDPSVERLVKLTNFDVFLMVNVFQNIGCVMKWVIVWIVLMKILLFAKKFIFAKQSKVETNYYPFCAYLDMGKIHILAKLR